MTAQPGEPEGQDISDSGADDTGQAAGFSDEPAEETAAEPAVAPSDQEEGPRRRARRERAERRAAQERAEAIEQARREAKRQARADVGGQREALPRGAVRGAKLLLITALAAVILLALGLVLYFTPLMSVRDVEITGITAITRAEVLDTAQVPDGAPLLQVDTAAIADRVATIRRVASARVQRQYPSTVRIAVVERIPLVVKDLADGPHLFDRDGVDFATAPPPLMLPYLDTDNPGPFDPATRAALQVLTALAPDIAGQVSRVAAPSVASITLTLTDGRVVVWGSTDRTAEKARKLAALLTQPGHTYDVSSPDLPTVK